MRKSPFGKQEAKKVIKKVFRILRDYDRPEQIVEDCVRACGWSPTDPRTTHLMLALDSVKNPRKHP